MAKKFKRTPKVETPEVPKTQTLDEIEDLNKAVQPKRTEVRLRVKNTYHFLKEVKKGKAIITADIRLAWKGSEKKAKETIKVFTNLEVY